MKPNHTIKLGWFRHRTMSTATVINSSLWRHTNKPVCQLLYQNSEVMKVIKRQMTSQSHASLMASSLAVAGELIKQADEGTVHEVALAGRPLTAVQDCHSYWPILAPRHSLLPTAEDSAGREVMRYSCTKGLEYCRCFCCQLQQPQLPVDLAWTCSRLVSLLRALQQSDACIHVHTMLIKSSVQPGTSLSFA